MEEKLSRKRRSNDAIWAELYAAADAVWNEAGPIPSGQVARRVKKMKLSGSRFSVDTIRKRIAKRAPVEIRGKSGAPKKNRDKARADLLRKLVSAKIVGPDIPD